ncbi:ricin-type beta-trefoil lectin domain protein [Streptomyces bacillaris]|uniref:ricin-type beta-trefoil lectin domain protein n=1 Tax=Streptomyces bacillaris TaxID=68179 RepID=UPI003460CACA
MTRSSQKPPASPEAQAEAETPTTPAPASGTDGAPKASAGSPKEPGAAPDEAPVTGSPSAAGTPSEATAAPEAANGATPPATTATTAAATATAKTSKAPATAVVTEEAGTKEADAGKARTAAGAGEAEGDTDPSASAAAQSRLPALVKTMSATAIGKPQPEAGPVGRPGKAALAGAAVVGALLVSVPFLVLAGNKDDEPRRTNTAAAGTVLDGNGQEAPGEFAVIAPETSAPPTTAPAEEKQTPPKAANPVPAVPPAAPSAEGKGEAKKDDGPKDPPKKADPPKTEPKAEPKAQPKPKNQPAKAQPAVTFRGPFSFRSHLSGRCIDVPGHNFNDGQRLFMWDCNGADAQKWRIGSDGTIRARDKCLDVAGAVFRNGTPIQLAWCNGSAAQKFDLNPAHDLVNTVVGMCVDIPNHSKSRGPSTYLILWECTGLDNQKWSS